MKFLVFKSIKMGLTAVYRHSQCLSDIFKGGKYAASFFYKCALQLAPPSIDNCG